MQRRDILTGLLASTLVAGGVRTVAASTAPATASGAVRAGAVEIGTGRPKIIVSLAGRDASSMVEQARIVAERDDVDIVEIRLDHLSSAPDVGAATDAVRAVLSVVGTRPLLATFRSRAEGGEKDISLGDYAALYRGILDRGGARLIDVELALMDDPGVVAAARAAREAGVALILSHHDFHSTPSVEEMVGILERQRQAGADICKIAVMPSDVGDVLRLLDATRRTQERFGDRPLITMAMGGLGVVSRVAGEVFGSAATFGSLGGTSAPGQIEVAELRNTIDLFAAALETSNQ